MLIVLLLLWAPFSFSAAAVPPGTSVRGGMLEPPPDDLLKLRDPFKRPDSEIAKVIAKSELERYPVNDFKMIAVLTGPDRLRAVLIANDGKSFVVRKGMRIGQHDGVILKITTQKVFVREKVYNVLGQYENLDTEIALRSDSKLPDAGPDRK